MPYKPSSRPDPRRIGQLIIKYLSHGITDDESEELSEWISASESNKRLFEKFTDGEFYEIIKDPNYVLLNRELKKSRSRSIGAWNTITKVFTAILVLIILAVAYYLLRPVSKDTVSVIQPPPTIPPSHNNVILTLSNGQVVSIDSMNKPIAQGSSLIKKTGNELEYIPGGTESDSEGFNSISTLSGKQFKIVFQDGSKVWLNAGTSIRYPTSFNSKERMVEITGEAYFEIETIIDSGLPENRIPFIVKTNGMDITVKGTKFNVQAYENDYETKTTLLEGAIDLRKGAQTVPLRPGQQAILANDSIKLQSNFNEEEVLSWKANLFVFQHMDIEPLMRQIARWYNVTVVYEAIILDRFTITVPRDIPLENLLSILQLSCKNVHFRIENKNTVIVSK